MADQTQTLNQALLAALAAYPGYGCFEIRQNKNYEVISYDRFKTLVFRLVNFFQQQELGRGERVAIITSNSIEWMIAYVACLLAGGVATIVRHAHSPDIIKHVLQDSGASMAVVNDAGQAHQINESMELFPELRRILVRDSSGSLPSPATPLDQILLEPISPELEKILHTAAQAIEPEALAAIHYTAGETGLPKGVVFTQQQRLLAVQALRKWFTLNPDDQAFVMLPWGWSASLDVSLHCFLSGVSNALPQSQESSLDDMQETSPTVMLITPLLLERLYDNVIDEMREPHQAVFRWAIGISKEYRAAGKNASEELREQYIRANLTFFTKIQGRLGGQLERIYLTGATLPQPLVDFANALDLTPLNIYSLTEAGGFPAVSRPMAWRPEAVGQAAPGFKIRIAADGELLIKSDTCMHAYWQQPEETERIIDAEGWLHSGDLGRLDEDNYLYITGRKSTETTFVLTSGHKVLPLKIEQALMKSPLVDQAAVFGDRRQYVSALIIPNLNQLASHFQEEEQVDEDHSQPVRQPLKWFWQHENKSERLVATNAHPNVQKMLDSLVLGVNRQLNRWERIRAYSLLEQSHSETAEQFAKMMPTGRQTLAQQYAQQIDPMYPAAPRADDNQITQVQVVPDRLHNLLEKKNILDAWLADAGIGFLFDLARHKQIDAPSLVHICDTVASIAQMENEEKPLSTAFFVGNPVKIARNLPPSPVQLLRRDHIRRMRNYLIMLAPLVDGLSMGYVVDTHGIVRGIHRLKVDASDTAADLLFGPQFRLHAMMSKQCEAVVFFVPTGGRQVRVFTDGQLVGRYSDGDWSPESIPRVQKIIEQLGQRRYEPDLLRRLLRCAFSMSEENMGAIFVLGDAETVLAKSDAPEISHFALINTTDIKNLSDRELINFAKQDGATVIDSSGKFSGCMVLLRPTATTAAEVSIGKGARHTSAAKMSAEARCLAITVSQDGPITIYHEGKQVVTL